MPLDEDIQVKEAEALRATISMLVSDMPELIKGRTRVVKNDNQVLKAVWEKKGTSQNLLLNSVGKQIFGCNFWVNFISPCIMSNLKTMYPISMPDNLHAFKPLFPNTYSAKSGENGALLNWTLWHLLLL